MDPSSKEINIVNYEYMDNDFVFNSLMGGLLINFFSKPYELWQNGQSLKYNIYFCGNE